jgi:hypothetical protein
MDTAIMRFIGGRDSLTMGCMVKIKNPSGWKGGQFTILLAQLLLAKASGLALKAKPIPSI